MATADQVLDAVMSRVRARADPARAQKEKAYLKSALHFHGLTLPTLHRIEREIEDLVEEGQLRAVVQRLWAEPVHEPRVVAVELLERRARELGPDDLVWIEALLRDCHTWAYVDALAANVVGSIVQRHPEATEVLDRWIQDPDFWIRRSAMLALLIPLRQGRGDPARFFRYAGACLDEKEFFIRKAIGWVLRDMGRKRPELVAAFVATNASRMSGLTFREAIRSQEPAVQAELRARRSEGK